MSADWPEFQLGSRCLVKSSKRIFAHEYVDSGIPFMRSKDVIDKALGTFENYDLYISEERFSEIKKSHGSPSKGDLLMSSVGNRSGQPYVIQDEGDFHFKDGNILWVSQFDDINSDYLAYWLKSELGQNALASVMIGSAQKALTIDSIRKLWVRFPPIEYQNTFAAILSSLDNKIELNRQTNQTLEEMAQAVFKSWFVDFEPTRAKIKAKENGEDPTRAAMAALAGKTTEQLDTLSPEQLQTLSATAALFPDAMESSELGEIPEGWSIEPLKCVAENHSKSFDFSKSDQVVFVNTGDVLEGRFLHKKYSKKDDLPGQAKKSIQQDDILFSEIRPKNKRFAYVNNECDDYVVSTKFMIIRSLGLVHPRYLYQILRQRTTINEFNTIAESRSGTFPQITFDSIGGMPVIVPPKEIQEVFMEFFSPIVEKLDLVEVENKYLERLRDTLLPKLLSGEIDLSEDAA